MHTTETGGGSEELLGKSAAKISTLCTLTAPEMSLFVLVIC